MKPFDALMIKDNFMFCAAMMEGDKYFYNDGSHTIFLSTKGKNPEEVSHELLEFLKYVEKPEAKREEQDEYVEALEYTIARIKTERGIRGRYMTLEELIEIETEELQKQIEAEKSRAEAEKTRADAAEGRAAVAEAQLEKYRIKFGDI